MLSATIKEKKHVYSICEKSGDIACGMVFKTVRIIGEGKITKRLAGRNLICCANADDDEKVFRSEDGRYYFSICDGWGFEGDTLYGIKAHIFHDFGHSTSLESALAECDVEPKYSTWGGAMACQAKKGQLNALKMFLENFSNLKNGNQSEKSQ